MRTTVIDKLQTYLANLPPGPSADTGELERLLAACWHDLASTCGGMEGWKLLGRMEAVAWNPPLLTFTVERHGGTVLGSTRATLQEWAVDMDVLTARCVEGRSRQVRPMQRRLDVRPLAQEMLGLIYFLQADDRLRWYEDGRVRVLIGKVLPDGSAAKRTLAGRRKRFRQSLREMFAGGPWEEVSPYVYKPTPTQHRQVRVTVGGIVADVDEELAPLIEQLWKAGIATSLSCQENRPGIAWIMFPLVGDLSRFLDIVAEYDPEDASLYRRISLASDDEGCWEYDVLPEDDALHEEFLNGGVEEWHEGEACFYFNVSVRFPRTDLPTLLQRLMRHNGCLGSGEGAA